MRLAMRLATGSSLLQGEAAVAKLGGMKKRSVFGELLDHLLATFDEPLSTVEMAKVVGCSPQRAYA